VVQRPTCAWPHATIMAAATVELVRIVYRAAQEGHSKQALDQDRTMTYWYVEGECSYRRG